LLDFKNYFAIFAKAFSSAITGSSMREVKLTIFVFVVVITSLFFGDSSIKKDNEGKVLVSIEKPIMFSFSMLIMPFGLVQMLSKSNKQKNK
jgi:hypothetical protein